VNLWRAAAELLRRGEAGVLATVAGTRGSTPVPAGTKMLVGADGRLAGTVGGGCVEADVIGAAAEALRTTRPLLVTHHLNADLAGDLGLSCGGTVEILIEPLVGHPAYLAVLDAAAGERGIVTTATAWPSGPDKTFAPLDAGADRSDAEGDPLRAAKRARGGNFGQGLEAVATARLDQAPGLRDHLFDSRRDGRGRRPSARGVTEQAHDFAQLQREANWFQDLDRGLTHQGAVALAVADTICSRAASAAGGRASTA